MFKGIGGINLPLKQQDEIIFRNRCVIIYLFVFFYPSAIFEVSFLKENHSRKMPKVSGLSAYRAYR